MVDRAIHGLNQAKRDVLMMWPNSLLVLGTIEMGTVHGWKNFISGLSKTNFAGEKTFSWILGRPLNSVKMGNVVAVLKKKKAKIFVLFEFFGGGHHFWVLSPKRRTALVILKREGFQSVPVEFLLTVYVLMKAGINSTRKKAFSKKLKEI